MTTVLRYSQTFVRCTGTRAFMCGGVFLYSILIPVLGIPAAIEANECKPVEPQSAEVVLSEAQTIKLQAEWKRAIDQDKTSELWRLLGYVDAGKINIKSTNDKGKTALMAAVKTGDQCLLAELLQRGLSISDKAYTGGTALMYAVLGNQAEMIDLVLLREQELNSQSANGWTAVMIAAAKGFKGSMQQLYKAGADINIPDVYQWTPLMRAIDNRHSSVVNYLLSLPGVDVRHINENGSTTLHIAAQTGDRALVTRLLELDADVTATDKNGFTASHVAIENNYPGIAEVIANSRRK